MATKRRCRAGNSTRYNTGDEPESLLGAAVTFELDTAQHWPQWRAIVLPGHDGYEFTAPVGSFVTNAFGLFDTHGKVWEWVAYWYGERYHGEAPRDDPPGPADPIGRSTCGRTWSFQ